MYNSKKEVNVAAIQKKKIAEMVIDEIKNMLTRGELVEGDKLPNQYEFAKQLGVSRPSLREALNQLTINGVVEQKPGAGTILKVANPDLWFALADAPLLSDVEGTLELLEARAVLEPIAIRMAVKKMDSEDLVLIEESLKTMEKSFSANDIEEYLKEDFNFHCLIANSAHNRYILQTLINLKRLMEEFMKESFEKIENLLPNSLEHHHAIYEALKNRDEKQSVFEIKNHISDIEIMIQTYYKERNML
jgi:GntR family transcriptional repressor for pyruvate dehydrogenase complex